MNFAPLQGLQFRNIFEINQTAKAGIQENSGCNDEKSPRARRKNTLKVSQKIFVFLVTNHELEGEDMGPFENISKGKLYDEIGKQADRGTMSKPHSQSRWPPPSLHVFFFRHHCRDSSDSTPFKIKKNCGPVPQLKPFAKKRKLKSCSRNADQGISPITGKAEHVLLSIVLGYCILIAFLFLGYFCQSVHPFDVAICRINQSRVLVNTNPSMTRQEM